MKFRVIRQKTPSGAHSPIHVVELSTGQGVGWINRFLDREYVRRLADKSLYSYAHSLLHFVRWWNSDHHPAISPSRTSANRLYSTTYVSSPAASLRPLPPPSTTGSPPPIALSAASSPTLPVRWRTGFVSPSCTAGRWD